MTGDGLDGGEQVAEEYFNRHIPNYNSCGLLYISGQIQISPPFVFLLL